MTFPEMAIVLATLAVAFAAFCVWLTVRIANRKERWAKWTLAGVVGMPVLYVASFGPVCWIAKPYAVDHSGSTEPRRFTDDRVASVPAIYFPIGWAAERSEF